MVRWAAFFPTIVAIAHCGLPHEARAQPSPDADRVKRAETAFKRGSSAFDSGDVQRALAEFRESFALWPRPRTLLNIAVSLKKLGRLAEAANLLAEYLAHPAAESDRLDPVKKTLASLDKDLARIVIAGDDRSGVEIDGQPISADDLVRPFRVAPGKHVVSRNGTITPYELARDQTVEVPLARATTTPVPRPVVIPPPRTPATRTTTTVSTSSAYLWAGGATVVAAGVTTYLGLRFRSAQTDLDDALASPSNFEYAEAVRRKDRARDAALLANIGLGVTAAGVVTTAVLFAVRKTERQTSVTVTSTSHSIGLVLVRGF